MEETTLHSVLEVLIPKLKLNPMSLIEEDPNTIFSQIPNGVLYLKNARGYTC